MKSLAEQIGGRCTHYTGLSGPGIKDNSATRCCAAGVVYLTVRDDTRKGLDRYPCFREGEAVPCAKRHFPTPEDIASEVAEHNASWDRLKVGIGAAAEDAMKHGFKKGNGGVGFVPCPVCKAGVLHYSVASYNGHMHGRCTTKDCLSWMQ